jgi:aminoglycoside phosphotransferase (APT) family kinase protein
MIGVERPTDSALTELLRSRLDPGLRCTGLRRAESGNAQEIWFVEAAGPGHGEIELVLRISAGRGSLAHTDREREAEVLRALADTGLPLPRVHWAEGASGALGRPYLLMERLPGRPPGNDDETVARQLGALLARLHALGTAKVPGDEGVDAAQATAAELAAWSRRHEESAAVSPPQLGPLFDRLAADPPDRAGVEATTLWGDPGPHNVLVEDRRITAMLDWELWHRGDPLEDLGAALWATRGPAREGLLAGYESVSGAVDRAALAWFEAMACATRSVMLLAGVEAFLEDQPRPSAAALGHHLLVASLARAAELTGQGPAAPAPDPAPRPRGPHRLRPDPPETVAGVADFLAAEVLPTIEDRRLRRELKVGVALLRDAASRAAREEPDPAELDAVRRSIPFVEALYGGREESG